MKKHFKYIGFILVLFVVCTTNIAFSQQNQNPQKTAPDSLQAAKIEELEKTGGDRHVMLNAANNTGPRSVNIGLPAAVGGTLVVEHGLPVVYLMWPELPTKVWRQDASLNSFKLNDMGSTSVYYGDVGFSVATTNNLGTEKIMGNVSVGSNHFGLLKGTMNLSGPLNKKGLMFSVGIYDNFDPGYFNTDIGKYYSDQTQLYKVALTQEYKTESSTGSISVFYKYGNSKGMLAAYSPFTYEKDGKVSEINGLTIGETPFYERSGRIQYKDLLTGDLVEKDVIDDFGTESHTIDIIGKNKFDNGLNFDYTLRYHSADVGLYLPGLGRGMGIKEGDYTYMDGSPYKGNYIIPAWKVTNRSQIDMWSAYFQVGKKTETHNWAVGLQEQHYELGGYWGTNTVFFQGLENNPSKLIRADGLGSDKYGNFDYNSGLEFNRGFENKLALYLTDKWDISPILSMNYGGRMELKTVNGEWAPQEARKDGVLQMDKLAKINENYWNKAANMNLVLKLSSSFGLLGEGGYTEMAPQLENYAGAVDPMVEKSSIPSAGLGVFYNNPLISLVSKATYITKDNNIARLNEKDPTDPSKTAITTVNFNMETIGWTTDLVASPFKGFDLHLLVTLQAPQYRNYSGVARFIENGNSYNFDFTDKTVAGISKVLLEIDPSYSFTIGKKNMAGRIWASARYFSKQYVNLANTVYYAPRWETFAGVSFSPKNTLTFSINVVNLLNQRGASGAIEGMNLFSEEAVQQDLIGNPLTGTTIRPFTFEVSAAYRF